MGKVRDAAKHPAMHRTPSLATPSPTPIKYYLNQNVNRAAVMKPAYAEVLKVTSLTRLVSPQVQDPTPLLQPEQDKGTVFGKGKV